MELLWIGPAFVFGSLAKRLGQPPLIGFLVAGVLLELVGLRPDEALHTLADLGVMLMLFGIGLKLDLRTLGRPEVFAPALMHMALTVAGGVCLFLGLAHLRIGSFADLGLSGAAILGFALSFSSTVFAVKLLEDRDDMGSVYGRVAIGVLVVQDLVAVAFMAASKGTPPSPWALGLVLLIPLRPVFARWLSFCGHGEMLVLAGVGATLGGAGLFEVVGLKGDLGALVAGALLGGSPKGSELSKSLYGLKDVFLVGFFLLVGLSAIPTVESVLIALALVLLVPLKGLLFFGLSLKYRLRARSALLSSVALTQYSEFGLIVGAGAIAKGWLDEQWMGTLALALVFSYVLSSAANERALDLYRRMRLRLTQLETAERVPGEEPVAASGAEVLVFGMGRIGTGAHDTLVANGEAHVVGFDVDPSVVARHQAAGRDVRLASATDPDFWSRLRVDPARVRLVLLAMSSQTENVAAIRQLREERFPGFVCASGRYEDEVGALREEGADAAFHIFDEAAAGFAEHALELVRGTPRRSPSHVQPSEA
ncbi:MAG: cation:proton antiporter family protein [Polyangiales bacterium]|nr:cation:proton antiporter [Myxococcales bacterium]